MIKRNILLNPGPATTTDSVKNSQVVPDICPREKEFAQILDSIIRDLLKIAGAGEDYSCVLIGGSGTAAMDAVINSVVKKKILIINNGAYGERMARIAQAYGLDYEELIFDWRDKIDLEKIEKSLKEDKEIGYLAAVHHETTTGILNPIKKLGEIAKKHNCLFILDVVSSFAGLPLNVKENNIDFMFSTSNKCLQGMPGVAFIICKKQELEKLKDHKIRSFYLDLYRNYEFYKKNKQTPFTPPVQTLYALRKAIDELLEEGLENRFKRYKKNNEVLLKGMKELGFKKIYENVEESGILTTFFEPLSENYSFEKLHDLLYARGFTIYPGKIKEKTFRIANMGAIDPKDIENFLRALKEVCIEMKLL